MTLSPRYVTNSYAVLGQMQPADLAEAKALGFRSIINNRPDGEEPGQPAACDIAQAALQVGLSYVHIPVSGTISQAQQQAMRDALATLPQPVLAFCRSGARSTRIWAHAMRDQLPPSELLAAAQGAGCDVVALQVELEHMKANPHE